MTPADITAWRNHLPMADLGAAAKKIYHAISDCNKVKLDPKERFEILELFRPLIQFVCQSLSKHYINQTSPLTKQQLTIAQLAGTLQSEMADGYKLLVEEIASKGSGEQKTVILPLALQRIIHYFTHILLRCFHLYTVAPKGIWQELYLLHQFSDKNQLLKQNNLDIEFKRIMLLAAAFPYQWRQSEQEAIYKATETWAPLISLRKGAPDPNNPQTGILGIDFSIDHSPTSFTRGTIQFSDQCRILDVNPILERIQKLLEVMEPNELKARIAHSNEPEYMVSSAILYGLIKEWRAPVPRAENREKKMESAKICVGLSASHYFVGGEKVFQTQHSTELESNNLSLGLPTLGLQDETSFALVETGFEKTTALGSKSTSEKSGAFPIYLCTIIDEHLSGYGLVWKEESYPPIQAGEVIGIRRENKAETQENKTALTCWEIGVVRWLQKGTNDEFRIGIEKFSKAPRAGAAQLIKEGQPSGYYLRCLIFETSILTPTLPFKPGSQVSVLENGDNAVASEIELSKLLDSTGSFKRFEFTLKKAPEANTPPPTTGGEGGNTPSEKLKEDSGKKRENDDAFDSIWSNL